jgi:PIN domain nuclease of toxin-antitoxin system
MRALVDTHVLLWAASDPDRLSPRVRSILERHSRGLLVSPVTGFEIGQKVARGRLVLPEPPDSYTLSRIAILGLEELPLTLGHALAATLLPAIHADPWDRLLVAQAQAEDVPIVSADRDLNRYEVEILW